jgi:1,4-dihydroxy-6-naphthoate synthase
MGLHGLGRRSCPEVRRNALRIRVAHSPDSDDAFMFYALAEGRIQTGPYEFEHVLSDIETLNQKAREGAYEVTALSIHAFAHLADRYALLPHGASMGDGYGPVVVTAAERPLGPGALKGKRIAVPGRWTSAYLALRLFEPAFEPVFVDFQSVGDAVRSGSADAGVLIHEGQLTYAQEGLARVVDLGRWWQDDTGLPLPLGGNAIRRDLPAAVRADVSRLLHDSIRYGLDHRRAALEHAMHYARGLSEESADQFVGMYVNDWTVDYGERGRKAVRLFLGRGADAGWVPPVDVAFDAPAASRM